MSHSNMEYPRLAPRASPFRVLPAFDSRNKISAGMQIRTTPIQSRVFRPRRDLQRIAMMAPTARLSPIMKVLLKISALEKLIMTPRRTGQRNMIDTQRMNKPLPWSLRNNQGHTA